MRIALSRKPLRRDWSRHPAAKGLLLESDIGVGHGRLKAKLMVFHSRLALRKFWAAISKFKLGAQCLGAVHQLSCKVMSVNKSGQEKKWIECDPRYFCVIGLVRGHLSMEIICHEAIHAGFAYAKRRQKSPWDHHALDFDEEAVCYPAGAIAAAINRAIHDAGLYPD